MKNGDRNSQKSSWIWAPTEFLTAIHCWIGENLARNTCVLDVLGGDGSKFWWKFGLKIERKNNEKWGNVEMNILSWTTELKICSHKKRKEWMTFKICTEKWKKRKIIWFLLTYGRPTARLRSTTALTSSSDS